MNGGALEKVLLVPCCDSDHPQYGVGESTLIWDSVGFGLESSTFYSGQKTSSF